MAENITTDNIRYVDALTYGLPSAADLGMFWDTASSILKKYYVGLNRGVEANAAVLSALVADVITTLPRAGDFAVFASTATNIPSEDMYYISCIGGGYSVTGANYLAFRTGGYVYFGYIAIAGTITWIQIGFGSLAGMLFALAPYTESSLSTLASITEIGTVIPDGYALGQLWKKLNGYADTAVITSPIAGTNLSSVRMIGRIIFVQMYLSPSADGTFTNGDTIFSISGLPVSTNVKTYRSLVVVNGTVYKGEAGSAYINYNSGNADIVLYTNQNHPVDYLASDGGIFGSACFYID